MDVVNLPLDLADRSRGDRTGERSFEALSIAIKFNLN